MKNFIKYLFSVGIIMLSFMTIVICAILTTMPPQPFDYLDFLYPIPVALVAMCASVKNAMKFIATKQKFTKKRYFLISFKGVRYGSIQEGMIITTSSVYPSFQKVAKLIHKEHDITNTLVRGITELSEQDFLDVLDGQPAKYNLDNYGDSEEKEE